MRFFKILLFTMLVSIASFATTVTTEIYTSNSNVNATEQRILLSELGADEDSNDC